METEYQNKLSQIINESFGYNFIELYDTLKENIIDFDLFLSMIKVVNIYVKDILDNTKTENKTYFKTNTLLNKMCHTVTSFFIKMSDIYEPEMLKTLKLKIDEKEQFAMLMCKKDEKDIPINPYEVYQDVIHKNPIKPFEFIIAFMAELSEHENFISILKFIFEMTNFEVALTECGNCYKFRFLENCDCEHNSTTEVEV